MRNRLVLFARYLGSALIPVVVLAVMGLASVLYTRAATEEQLDLLHDGILNQLERSVEYFFSELNATSVAMSASSQFLVQLRDALGQGGTDFASLRTVAMIRDIINPSVYARPALHSLYVIFDDFPDAVLSSEFGVISLESIPDRSWIPVWQDLGFPEDLRVLRRTFQPLVSDTGSRPVISFVRRIAPLERSWMRGAVILNVSVESLHRLVEESLTHAGQRLVILGPDGDALYGVSPPDLPAYRLSSRTSRSGWVYRLYTPQEVFSGPARQSLRISVTILLGAALVGIIIAVLLTRRQFRSVRELLALVDSAEAGDTLPELPGDPGVGFDYINHQILKSFLRTKYLEVQLSERAYRERTMELLFLQSQLNPHFLFNTLEVLNWKTLEHTQHPTELNEIISRLAEMLQYSLEGPSRFVSLQAEVENGRNYLAIQQLRYGDRLRHSWDIAADTRDVQVVPMLIQPLLENAIYHGIRDCEKGGTISVTTRLVDHRLCLSVTDNGKGMDAEALAELRRQLSQAPEAPHSEHVGLINSRRRLELAFPGSSSVAVESSPGAGFTVTVTLISG